MNALLAWMPLRVSHDPKTNILSAKLRLSAKQELGPLEVHATSEQLRDGAAKAFRVAIGSAFYFALTPSLYKLGLVAGVGRAIYEFKLDPSAPPKYSFDVTGKIIDWMKENEGEYNAKLLGAGALAGVLVRILILPNMLFSAGMHLAGIYEGYHAGLLIGKRGAEALGSFVVGVIARERNQESTATVSDSPQPVDKVEEPQVQVPDWVTNTVSQTISRSIINGFYTVLNSELNGQTWVLTKGYWVEKKEDTQIIASNDIPEILSSQSDSKQMWKVVDNCTLAHPITPGQNGILWSGNLCYVLEHNAWYESYYKS